MSCKIHYFVTVGLILFPECLSICANGVYVSEVSNIDINVICNKHNELRMQIAQGNISGQPRGINLKRIYWDTKLAQAAQQITNTCEFKHVPVSDNRWYVGQNILTSYSSAYDNHGPIFQDVVQSWFDEYKEYHYPNGFSTETGHYTQVIWAETMYVGCGYTYAPLDGQYHKFYVCNYGPGGNVNNREPYKTGKSGCENLC